MSPEIFYGPVEQREGEIHTLSAALIFRVSAKHSIRSGILVVLRTTGILSMPSFRYRSFDTAPRFVRKEGRRFF